MKKNFLLLLLLTLLPLAGWAQTSNPSYEWTSGSAPDLTYGDATPNFGNLVTVLNGYSDYPCANYGEETDYTSTTDYNNRFHWAIFKKSGTTQIQSSTTLDAGDYELRLYIRHRSSGGGFENVTRTLEFTVAKKDVTVTLYQVVREWRNPWANPNLATLEASAYTVDGASFSDVLAGLSWNQVQAVEDVDSYKYTFDVDNDSYTNYTVHIDAGAADLKVEKNTTSKWETIATDGDELTYNGDEQSLEPKVAPEFMDTDGNIAGKIEYSLNGTDWSTEYPKAKDAATYTITYRGVGDQNHIDAPTTNTYQVKIKPADLTPVPADEANAIAPNLKYNAANQKLLKGEFPLPEFKEVGQSGTFHYYVDGTYVSDDWNDVVGQDADEDADAYVITYTFTPSSGNFNPIATEQSAGNANIAKAENDFTTPPAVITATTYDATAKDLLANFAAVATKGGAATEVQYKVIYTPNYPEGSKVEGTYAATAPKGTEAGKYEIYRKVLESANYKPIGEDKVGEVTIAKAPVEIFEEPAGKDGLVYNNANQQLLKRGVTVYFKGAKVTPISADYTMGANTWTKWDQPEAKDADTYTITCQVKFTETAHKNNFIVPDAFDVTATIAQAGLDIAAQSIEVDWTGTAVDLEAQHYAKGDPDDFHGESEKEQYEIVNSLVKLAWIVEAGNTAIPTDAGYYKFELAPVDTDPTPCNYKINTFSPNGSLQINKVDATAAIVAAATPTYNGTEQALLTVAGEVKGGTMLYFVGDAAPGVGDSKWETAVPKKTDAGTYKVWYMTKGDKNHNDVAAAQIPDTKIKQAPLAIEIANTDKVYGEEDPIAFNATYTSFVNSETAETIGLSFTRAKAGTPEGEDVGTYAITPVWDATKADKAANYDIDVTNGTFTITKAPAAIATAPVAKKLIYNRKAQELVEAGVSNDGTVMYSLTGEAADFAEAIPTGIVADDYDVYYMVKGDANHTDLIVKKPVVVTIEKAEVTDIVAPAAISLTYKGADQVLVEPAKFEDEFVKGTFTYAVTAEGEDAPADEDYAAELPIGFDAGVYTVYTKFAPNSNHKDADVDPVTVTINKATIVYTLGAMEKTYDGEAITEAEAAQVFSLTSGADGTKLFGDDEYDRPFTLSLPEDYRDAGTYTFTGAQAENIVAFKEGYPVNYIIQFTGTGTVTIKKAAPADFTAPVANDLTFNGHSRKLVSAGEVSVVDEKPLGTILFSTTEDGTYTEAIPEGTNAGVYNVWYMVKGDANHSDTKPAKVADVKIKPYALTADMLKATAADLTKVYNGQVQSFNIPVKVKFAGDKNETVLEEATDGKKDFTVTINGKARKDIEVKNAGAYEFAFTGTNNYTGTVTTTAYITKLELIATAPNAVKTYDGTAVIEPEEFECTATQLKLYGGLEISGLLADDKIDLGGKTIADIIVPEGSAINVGTYNLKVNLAAIPEQANYTFNPQTFDGKLTINKAEAVKIGFFTWEEDPEPNTEEAFWGTKIVKTKEYSKSYGTNDPVFITPNGTNDVTSIAGDLMALEGELFEDNAVVATLLGATRTEGHVYTKDGYTVKLGWKNTSNTAELAKIATFKNNYKNVTFGTTKLKITPFEGTIKVSIKSDAVVFDGKEHADAIAWAEDLSNMVVVGMPANNKDKKEIFTELPTITVTPKDGKVRNAGDYNITLSGGKSENYDMKKVQFVLGSYLTVEPFEITPDMVTIPDQQAKLDDKAKDAIKHDAFEFKDGAVPAAEGVNLYDVFQVVAAPDFVDGNGKIKLGENPAEGLTLARKDNTNAEALNYTGYDEVFGYLAVIGTPNLLVLDDTKDIATKDRENTVVTFTSRTISQDNWNVVCLPFDATIKQISDAFGYAAVDLLKKESVDGSMHFVVTTSGTVPAGEPFIIKPTSDPELNAKKNFDQVKFTGVTVKEFSDNPEPVKDSAGNKFCGTFKAHTYFSGEKFWYMSKSEWKQASNFTEANPVDLGAYRAYIETATAEARIFIEEPDGTITAINAIDLNNNAMDEGWYTVNGMKLNAAPTQKGTYIKDGKKVFVK